MLISILPTFQKKSRAFVRFSANSDDFTKTELQKIRNMGISTKKMIANLEKTAANLFLSKNKLTNTRVEITIFTFYNFNTIQK